MRCWILGLPVLLLVFLGCGPSGPERFRVNGIVKLDGVPLPEGVIHFEAVDREMPDEMAQIISGKYEVRVIPGKRIVRISSERVVEGKQGVHGMPLREQVVPERYNEATILNITVTANQVQDFDLHSH